MPKLFVSDLLADLGKIRTYCESGHNEDARQACRALERRVQGITEDTGVLGAEIALSPVEEDEEPEDEEQTPPDADVTPTHGEPPLPGGGE